MILKIRRKILNNSLALLLGLFIFLFLFSSLSMVAPSVLGLNITNKTVIARVNVTNTEPYLYLVRVMNTPIDLTAGNTTDVICNGSFSDPNGVSDIKNVTATLYRTSVASDALDDNNTHYSNASCLPCDIVAGTGSVNGTCLCQFPVQYYAENGTWQCNMTVRDSVLLNSSLNSTVFQVNEVIGIDVSTTSLDYGNLSATQISSPTRENVINIGNIPLNVTVRGYGDGDESIGQNYTMICEGGSNISFGYQRFSLYNDTAFSDMYNLTNQTRQIPGMTVPKRVLNNALGNSTNSTWWKLQIPLGPAGICNGTIIFGAARSDY